MNPERVPPGGNLDRGLTGILFTQRLLTSPEPPEAFIDVWDCAYQAIED
jgi:hypothetical protein